jgi:hypothetical protein
MRRVTGVVVALLAGGFGMNVRAEVPADPVAAFYGATLEIENIEGWYAKRYLNPDRTFTQTGSDGAVKGTWAVEGGKLCATQQTPPPAPDRARTYCNVGPGHKVGDKWEDSDPVTGNVIYFSLHPGR